MARMIKKLKKNLRKVKPVFKKARKFSKRVVNNIDDYLEMDHREARKMQPGS